MCSVGLSALVVPLLALLHGITATLVLLVFAGACSENAYICRLVPWRQAELHQAGWPFSKDVKRARCTGSSHMDMDTRLLGAPPVAGIIMGVEG